MLRDLRAAARALARAPGLVAAAVLSIAVGVGANATAFAWFKSVTLDPLPHVQDVRGLVHLKSLEVGSGARNSISYPDYLDWRAQATQVEGIAVYAMDRFGVRTAPAGVAGETTPVWGNYASVDYFASLGVRPALGRFWRADEASVPGGPPVVVVSDAFWRGRLAADPGVVGRTVWVNGVACTVIGVAPPRFAGAFVGMAFDVWVPITMYPRLADWKTKLDARTAQWLLGFARPRAGATLAGVNAELAAVGTRVAAAAPTARGRRPLALPFAEGDTQRILTPLLSVLLGAAGLVQLVVCANVANLLLARTAARRRELGVRAALGAGRGRLVRELAAEGVLLAAAGAALGVPVATIAGPLLETALPAAELPVHVNASVDWRVLAVGAALAAVTALLAGAVPAWRATRGVRGDGIARILVQGGRGTTRASGGGARALVVAQLALSVVSLVSAGLFLRSLAAVGRTDLGFRAPEQVLVASTDLTLGGRSADSAGRRLVGRWVERVRALPGVETAAVSDYVPLGLGYSNRGTFVADGYAARPDENLSFLFNTVGEHYFRTLGIPLVRGRAFDARDGAAAPPVAIVNETYARRFLAGRDPVGATARYGADGPPVTIVGVAADGRYGMEDLAGAPVPFVYVPYAQRPSSTVFLQVRVRAGADPLALVPAVRRALAAEDPALPLVRPTTLALWSRTASFVQRIGATVLMVLGTVALLLAAVGLYGVTAYTVARRTREIGVRVALGATTRRVVAGVLRDGGRTAAAGLVLGTVAAFAAARLLAAQLQGVRADDPAVFGAAGLLLLAVALAASWLPARRAARVPPTEALRAD